MCISDGKYSVKETLFSDMEILLMGTESCLLDGIFPRQINQQMKLTA